MTYPQVAPPEKQPENPAVKLGILLVLLAGLAFALIYFNLVSCGFYSSLGCDIYYSIVAGGKPRVLIVTGDEGMGNPEFMAQTLKGPHFSAIVNIRDISLVTFPLLTEYQLVIVEHARKMNNTQVKWFQQYTGHGGRLVWIGDAGTKLAEGDTDLNNFLLKGERKTGAPRNEYIGPWARKEGDKQVSLDYTLGAEFRTDYCEMRKCSDGELVGNLMFPSSDPRLAKGLSQGLPFYGDFSVVQLNDAVYTKEVGTLNYGDSLIATPPADAFWLKQQNQNFGTEFPVIISIGPGGRTAYYAFPPEYLVSERMPIDKATGNKLQYWGLLENMYYGMLYK